MSNVIPLPKRPIHVRFDTSRVQPFLDWLAEQDEHFRAGVKEDAARAFAMSLVSVERVA